MITSGRSGRLDFLAFASRREVGRRAATDIEDEIAARLAMQQGIRMVFAAAPSQNVVLEALADSSRIDRRRVTASTVIRSDPGGMVAHRVAAP